MNRPGNTTATRVSTAPARGTPRSVDRVLVAAFVAAVALAAFGLARHTMWFDELQAWSIARSSGSLPALFHHLRYEGHPGAWYLILYGVTRVTGDPRAMQAVELVIMAATFAVILGASPFSKPVRIALLAGYTIGFEYGVISRAYGLAVLALVVTLALLGRHRPAWGWALLSIAVLAWTSLAGAVLALAIAGAIAGVGSPRAGRARLPRPGQSRAVFVAGTGVAAISATVMCIPPADFHAFTPSVGSVAAIGSTGWTRLLTSATGTWRGLVPIPSRWGAWNSQLLDGIPAAAWIEAALSIALVALVASALRRSPVARVLWLLGSASYLGFFAVVVLPDQARYAGATFLLFLACAWWAFAPPGGVDPAEVDRAAPGGRETHRSRPLGALVVAVAAAQVVALLAIAPAQTAGRFAPNQALATAVRAAGLENRLVSGDDFVATSVGAYLDRPTFSVARGAWGRSFIHDDLEARRFGTLPVTDIVCTARRIARQDHHAAGVITVRPVSRQLAGVGHVVTIDGIEVTRVEPDAAIPGCAITSSRPSGVARDP